MGLGSAALGTRQHHGATRVIPYCRVLLELTCVATHLHALMPVGVVPTTIAIGCAVPDGCELWREERPRQHGQAWHPCDVSCSWYESHEFNLHRERQEPVIIRGLLRERGSLSPIRRSVGYAGVCLDLHTLSRR